MAKKVGVLTGGGDCPGLNAVIRAVTRRSLTRGHTIVGVREGWRGLVDGRFMELGPREISGILPRGGTILGTTRTNPYKTDGGVEKVLENFRAQGLDALVAIGGEDTLGVASQLFAEHDLPVVGVPKTIDNDLSATDYTFGFDTAVFIATEAIDRLHTTAESHNRVMVVEVMGRHTGWIAVMSGIAGGADVILIPEQPVTVEEACDDLRRRHERGKDFSIVVVERGLRAHVRVRREAPGGPGGARDRPVRPRAARRRRRAAGAGDRGAHRLREPRDRPRPRAARRLPHPARPRPRDALRPEGRRSRRGGQLRHDGRPPGRRHRRRPAGRRGGGAEDGPAQVVRRRQSLFRLRAARRAGRSGCAAAGRGSSAGASSAGSS